MTQVRVYQEASGRWISSFDDYCSSSSGSTREEAIQNLYKMKEERDRRWASETANIRTEEEFDAQIRCLTESVEKMGDTAQERLDELIHLCAEERVHAPLVQTIFDRTHRRVPLNATRAIPIVFERNPSTRHPCFCTCEDPDRKEAADARLQEKKRLLADILSAREVQRDRW
jgi:hypothetical protein